MKSQDLAPIIRVGALNRGDKFNLVGQGGQGVELKRPKTQRATHLLACPFEHCAALLLLCIRNPSPAHPNTIAAATIRR